MTQIKKKATRHRCSEVTLKGEPCKAMALPGGEHEGKCFAHSPAVDHNRERRPANPPKPIEIPDTENDHEWLANVARAQVEALIADCKQGTTTFSRAIETYRKALQHAAEYGEMRIQIDLLLADKEKRDREENRRNR